MRYIVTAAALAAVLSASAAHAQTRQERGWLDVNFGVASSAGSAERHEINPDIHRERSSFSIALPAPSGGASFDVGGGVMLSPWIGIGVSVSGQAHEDPVELQATVPHPTFFNAAATGRLTTTDLQRTEGVIHIQAMFVPAQSPKARLRVFGGPSYFRYTADRVETIRWDSTFLIFQPVQEVRVTDYTTTEVEETAWGFHVGADASYFFTRVVGIGGFLRYSRATATFDDPFSLNSTDVTLGGVSAGGGLRLRF